MEQLHGLVSIFFCFLQNLVSLFICLAENTVPLGIQFFLAGFQLGFESFDLFFITRDLQSFIFNGNAVFFQRRKNILKGFVLFADLFLSSFNDLIGKSKFGRDGKGITFSGNTDQKAVGRTQGFYAEFAAGIFHTRCRKCVYLKLAVMGGCHGPYSFIMKIGKDGNGKGSTLRRVGSSTQLVKKNKRTGICFFQEGYNISHMRGKSTQRLFNALLIPDICINLMKKSQLTAVKSRNVKSCLTHKSKQTNGFQRNCFSSGIRTCDNQKVKIISQTDINGNYFLFWNQRMAGFFQEHTAFLVKNRFASVHIHGKTGSGKNKVKLYHQFQIQGNGFPFFCNLFT